MKINKRSRWSYFVIVFIAFSILLLTQVDTVQATFTNMHMFTVMLRVEAEIMQKTPAGRHYDSLFWKHSRELANLIETTPGKTEELIEGNRLFIPGFEALLDGNGETVHITSEQVETLKAQLDWFYSKGSPALQEDMQRELQRLSLDHFVGMTMTEAWDYINSKWTTDMMAQPTEVPELSEPTQTPLAP